MADIDVAGPAEGPATGSAGSRNRTGNVENSFWLFVSQALGIVVQSGIALLAIRELSVAAWGRYSTALACVAIATVFASSGLGALALREMANEPDRQDDVLGATVLGVALAALASCVVLVPITVALGLGARTVLLVALALPLCFLLPWIALLQAAFNVRRALHLAVWFQALEWVVFCVAGVAVLLGGGGAAGLVLVNVAAAAVAVIAALILLRRRLSMRPRLDVGASIVWKYLRWAMPMAAIGIATIVYGRLDVLMLSAIRGQRAVGLYAVPYNLVTLTLFIPSVLSISVFPMLNRGIAHAPKVPDGFLFLVRLFLLVSVPISILLGFAGAPLLSAIFGSRYAKSAHVLTVLAVAPVFSFQIYAFWYVILAAHHERRVLWIRVGGLVLNLITNAVLIPLYGPVGAAVSWLLAELFTALAQAVVVHRRVFPVPYAALLGLPAVGVAAASIPLALGLVFELPVPGALVGTMVYAVALLLSGYVQPRELAPILRILPFRSLRSEVHSDAG